MSFRISSKGKIIELPLPRINKKTLKKMEKKRATYNPLLAGIKDKKLSIRVIY